MKKKKNVEYKAAPIPGAKIQQPGDVADAWASCQFGRAKKRREFLKAFWKSVDGFFTFVGTALVILGLLFIVGSIMCGLNCLFEDHKAVVAQEKINQQVQKDEKYLLAHQLDAYGENVNRQAEIEGLRNRVAVLEALEPPKTNAWLYDNEWIALRMVQIILLR